jgi:hypothetical protein
MNERSILGVAKYYEKIGYGVNEYMEIQNIINSLIDKIMKILSENQDKKIHEISKKLNFPEYIYVKINNGENKYDINFDDEKVKFSEINLSGTKNYYDNDKFLASNKKEIFIQAIIYNIGKILFLLLNGFEYSSKNQLKNFHSIFSKYLDLTLLHSHILNLKNFNFQYLKLNFTQKQIEDEFNDKKKIENEMSSILPIDNNIVKFDNNLRKGEDYFILNNYGNGIIESSFSVNKRNKSIEKKFEENENNIFEEIEKKINDQINKIFDSYLGPV